MTDLHYTSNGSASEVVPFGFNLIDVQSVAELDALPAGTKGLVWLDESDGVTESFKAKVTPFIGHPKLFGFYLVDEPDPTGIWGKQVDAADLMAESDWIHARMPEAKTFITMMNMGSSADPDFSGTYNPANTHVDLFGLDPYPVRSESPTVDYDLIDRTVAAAVESGIPLSQIVPVYQAFGGGGWTTDTGGTYDVPSAEEMTLMLERWEKLVPSPAFDYAYSWGTQNGDTALEDSAVLQELFKARNLDSDMTPVLDGPVIVEKRVAAAGDDAEQPVSGSVVAGSSDLELGTDGGAAQAVGLRFTGIDIPDGAVITKAYIQFKTDEVSTGAASLVIRGQDVDDAAGFSSRADVASRPTTDAKVAWTPAGWTVVGAAGDPQRTPDLAAVVQEIVDRQGWKALNDIGFTITGTGKRTAEAFEGDAAGAPLLHIEYSLSGDRRPVAANDSVATAVDVPVTTGNVLANDDLGDAPARISAFDATGTQGGKVVHNGDGTFNYSPRAGFTGTDSFTYTVTDRDGDSSTASVAVAVTGAAAAMIEKRVAAGGDDAEQPVSGSVAAGSSDLELGTDGGAAQSVGLRFTGIDIPDGAVITKAYIQFKTDEVSTGAASLVIRGQDVDDAAGFSSRADVASRPTTDAKVAWTPPGWTAVGAAGDAQRTPDLAAVVQEIVDRQGWKALNDIGFTITGTGKRTAEAFEGDAAGAPLLHIEYSLSGDRRPVAANDSVATAVDVPVTTGNVLANDDLGDAPARITAFDATGAQGGSVVHNGDGTFTYSPRAGFTGTDSFTYTIADQDGDSSVGRVSVEVGAADTVRFAAFGDWADGSGTQAVADLIEKMDVDFIVTTGDNVYDPDEAIDSQIGRIYSDYIGNYTGSFGPGSSFNRFFPSLGNHDYGEGFIDDYIDYFTLPGNERYYDFVSGPVHLFAINSNSQDPDGATSTSAQARWLESALASSDAPYKIVYFHHAAYNSGSSHGSTTRMQWDFEDWGATAVLAGHEHVYERILRDDNGDGVTLPYFTTGLGGNGHYGFGTPVAGSQVRYSADYGTMVVEASNTGITFEFWSIAGGGSLVDSYRIPVPDGASPGPFVQRDQAATAFDSGDSGDDASIVPAFDPLPALLPPEDLVLA